MTGLNKLLEFSSSPKVFTEQSFGKKLLSSTSYLETIPVALLAQVDLRLRTHATGMIIY